MNTGDIPVTLHVGKNGITDALIEELKEQLRTKRTVKVKMLRSSGERKAVAAELAEKAGAELVEVRGLTVVLKRKK